MIRMRVWETNKTLGEEDKDEITHIDHCIDSIRQTLMCSADVSPIVFNWDPSVNYSRPISTIYHTCRDFEALRQWTEDHQVKNFDASTYVEDDL